jgi:hypothetical protein
MLTHQYRASAPLACIYLVHFCPLPSIKYERTGHRFCAAKERRFLDRGDELANKEKKRIDNKYFGGKKIPRHTSVF